MPELPDVEIYRERMADTSLHRRITGVDAPDTAMLGLGRERLAKALRGRELVRTHRHGKHLFARTDGDRWLVLHFGMTGRLEYRSAQDETPSHLRFALTFADGSRLVLDDQRRLGRVTITDAVDDYVAANELGQDALRIGEGELRAGLADRRGGLKSALMDQTFIAGIGNVYSDEILFQARLHPRERPPDVGATECRRLYRQLRRILEMAIDRGADPSRVPRTWLLPHRQDGLPCPRGNGRIEKHRVAGRGCFFCPQCQPRLSAGA